MRDIRKIVIHCSATTNGDPRVTLETIDEWHRAKGWRAIGYHFVIEADGVLREGRHLETIGAHVAGSNANSIGICMIGTDKFSEAQWISLSGIVEHLIDRFPMAEVLGHRDFSPDLDGDGIIEPWEYFKTCPGFEVDDWLRAGMHPHPAHVLRMH